MAPYTFSLFAPYNKNCALRLKNANTRMFNIDILMDKNEETGYFYKTIDLADGKYHYQFKILTKSWFENSPAAAQATLGNESEDVSDSNSTPQKKHKKEIETSATYTDIIYVFVDPYATEVDEQGTDDAHKSVGVLNINNGQKIIDNYEWKYQNHTELPANDELIIYEIHVSDFLGTFKDIIKKIDYFKKLGINAIQLMPVNQFAGTHSWGYNTRYNFAIEHLYGTTYQFKEMIDTLHGQGIRVFIDGVYNHTECSSPLTQIDHDYWFHHEPKEKQWSWGPEWNYDLYDEKFNVWPARKFVSEAIRYNTKEFHIDGLRFDSARQIRHFEFLKHVVKESEEICLRPFYSMAEYLPDNPDITIEQGGPCDAVWHDSFYWVLKNALLTDNINIELQNLKSVIDCRKQGYKTGKNVINYISNHDHDRLFVELKKEKKLSNEKAFHLLRLAITVLITSIGNILIWMGEEFGEEKEKIIGESKLQWELIETEKYEFNQQMFSYWCNMLRLRHEHKLCLKSDNLDFFFEDRIVQVFAYHRYDNAKTDHIIVIINWARQNLKSYQIKDIPMKGQWNEWSTTNLFNVNDDNILTIDLESQQGKIFILNKQ
ncbi:unnamed protein product [Adineta steineri]|uniref:Glycosyl hydrolase family 13 catalytic domain-containing protein n=1 Tax=Adineta steineri TaxID=433720 RepID=A0A813PHC6_9BILA|nr:unnamed protein product [Adineta steineri]CAF0755199.1 unnamed protein product [Adineta steineri]CAF3593956.1 unnamed protein product [Adineta steineri]CAF3750944.1 unnamed protein product [Adineta steineri]